MSTGGGRVSTPAAASLVAVAAAWRQHSVSGGSTINNQLKALAATATETAMMILMATMIETKAMAMAVLAAWRQHGGQHGGIAIRSRNKGDIDGTSRIVLPSPSS
jgi:hypothetical protein